ncbi:MAG: SNF2-related protein [Acidobacteriota bacterium]
MIILHAVWASDSNLKIWGEDSALLERKPRRKSKTVHPFACSAQSLRESLNQMNPAIDSSLESVVTLLLPTAADAPLPSPYMFFDRDRAGAKLARWEATAIALAPPDALDFLLSIGEGNPPIRTGESLRFFSEAAKLSLEMVARGRAIPSLTKRDDRFIAVWRAAPDEEDIRRLSALARAMPASCRAESTDTRGRPPSDILNDMIERIVDAEIRRALTEPLIRRRGKKVDAAQAWLAALSSADGIIEASESDLLKLQKQIVEWGRSTVSDSQATLRTCFRLSEPMVAEKISKKGDDSWRVEFLLQATDDRSLLVPADVVWKTKGNALKFSSRKLENPQEKLLHDLGRATRLYPSLETALRTVRPAEMKLDINGAYNFLRETAPLLEQSGFGVLVPAWWRKPSSRLGVRLKTSPQSKKVVSSGLLGLDSIVEYRWQVALGDEELSFEDFMKLASLKVPLVKVRGQWVELKQEEIEAALDFFSKRNESGEMTAGEAMRIGLGLDSAQVGLPVTGVEAKGWMKNLFEGDKQNIKSVKTPAGFVGSLRPYQERGLAWLSFLNGLGLGACLADDMGLGKCLSADSLIAVNGMLIRAEDIWNRYSGEVSFDGEGYWADPAESLFANSIDERSGRIVQTRIKKLYRQRVNEPLRKISLEDGSSVTITRRHKLLTDKGWTNELHSGDYVCVPAKTVWQGKPEDPDLIKFLAWQIAEGYESPRVASVTITQKNTSTLEELRECLIRLSEKHGIKINNPSIKIPTNGKATYLRINSAQYRRFLESRGYEWGRPSREKSIPPFVMQADKDSVRLFLRNYFDAEASAVESMRCVEISTASPLLINQLAHLLRRFGIWMRTSSKNKRATNGTGIFRTYYAGIMGGNAARKFRQEIGFADANKQARLERICQHKCNTNVEGIPASRLVADAIADTGLPVRHLGMHNTIYINGTQQFSRFSLERVAASVDSILSGESERKYRTLKPSKWTSQTLEVYSRLDTTRLAAMRDDLRRLLDQEVYYCRIKDISEIDYDGWVYDFEIERHHNFVANNILCHNTAQLLALLLNERQNGEREKTGPTLLVCPMSVVGNWQREAAKFAPRLRLYVHHGTERLSGSRFAAVAKKNDLVVTTYALAARDRKLFEEMEWTRVALDEAQNIKNPSAKQTQSVRSFRAAHRVALTGTPVENRLSELWSIMQFLNPGLLGSANDFHTRFATPIERYRDEEKAALLKRVTGPFILRRLKTDKSIIRDLPDKIEMKTYCNLTKEQASLYQAVVDEMMEKVEESEGMARRGAVLAVLMKLKQVCNHPAHLLQDGSSLENRSGKLARLEEIIEEILAEGDRALCFTQFAEMGHMLKSHLQERFGREVLFLHGGVTKKARDAMVERFQSRDGPPIFLLSLKAGGTGLNLTAAQHVIHFDRWWNPAVEDQATDRAFRIGQKRNVQVRKFVCVGTLEERIDQMIEQKKELAERIVGAGESWLTELSTAQLREMVALSADAVSEA